MVPAERRPRSIPVLLVLYRTYALGNDEMPRRAYAMGTHKREHCSCLVLSLSPKAPCLS